MGGSNPLVVVNSLFRTPLKMPIDGGICVCVLKSLNPFLPAR